MFMHFRFVVTVDIFYSMERVILSINWWESWISVSPCCFPLFVSSVLSLSICVLIHMKIGNLTTASHDTQNFFYRLIVDINVKDKMVKFLEDNIGISL